MGPAEVNGLARTLPQQAGLADATRRFTPPERINCEQIHLTIFYNERQQGAHDHDPDQDSDQDPHKTNRMAAIAHDG
jgi:hypothetical protein